MKKLTKFNIIINCVLLMAHVTLYGILYKVYNIPLWHILIIMTIYNACITVLLGISIQLKLKYRRV